MFKTAIRIVGEIAGVVFNASVNRSGTAVVNALRSAPIAKTGTLSTRTDDNTGVVTMTAGHGFATSDKIDLYWAGGRRCGMDATVAVNAVTLDGGTGDPLPPLTTPVTASKKTAVDIDFNGTLAKTIQIGSAGRVRVELYEGATLRKGIDLEPGDLPYSWYSDGPVANPVNGNAISSAQVSQGGTEQAEDIQIGVLLDA